MYNFFDTTDNLDITGKKTITWYKGKFDLLPFLKQEW